MLYLCMIADSLVNFNSPSALSNILPLYKINTIWFILDQSHNRPKIVILLNFDNIMYQIIAIFQKSSGLLGWELISSNSEKYIV